jgi:hypothetical protein
VHFWIISLLLLAITLPVSGKKPPDRKTPNGGLTYIHPRSPEAFAKEIRRRGQSIVLLSSSTCLPCSLLKERWKKQPELLRNRTVLVWETGEDLPQHEQEAFAAVSEEWGERLGIRGVPLVLVFDVNRGEDLEQAFVEKFPGYTSRNLLTEWLDKVDEEARQFRRITTIQVRRTTTTIVTTTTSTTQTKRPACNRVPEADFYGPDSLYNCSVPPPTVTYYPDIDPETGERINYYDICAFIQAKIKPGTPNSCWERIPSAPSPSPASAANH